MPPHCGPRAPRLQLPLPWEVSVTRTTSPSLRAQADPAAQAAQAAPVVAEVWVGPL